MFDDTAVISPMQMEAEVVNSKIQDLRAWLDENPKINGNKDSQNLLLFLRVCKYDIETTKQRLKSYYQLRAERTEWFANRNPFDESIQELLNLGVMLPIDGVDVEKRKVVVIRTSIHNPKRHSQNDVFKTMKMVLDLLLKMEPNNCANGIVGIFDMNGVTLGHAMQMNPRIIKRSVESWYSYPCQPKLLEFINTPPHVNLVLNTFRVFMKAKMRSRIIVQRKQCSVKIGSLPKNIGGEGPSYEELTEKWKQLVENNAKFYEEDEKYKSIL